MKKTLLLACCMTLTASVPALAQSDPDQQVQDESGLIQPDIVPPDAAPVDVAQPEAVEAETAETEPVPAGAAQAEAAPVQAAPPAEPAEDPAFEAAMAKNNVMTVRNVVRTELVHGLDVFDAGGKPVGKVERLSGNDVILSDGKREFTVPITEFFAYNQYGKDYFATRRPKAALKAQAPGAPVRPLANAD